MTLSSGLAPYFYDVHPVPVKASGVPVGLSGIMFEQAQFVITAERRRFLQRSTFEFIPPHFIEPRTRRYIAKDTAPWFEATSEFEPKTDGSTYFGNQGDPAVSGKISPLFVVNQFDDLRIILEGLFNLYSLDLDFNAIQIREDWLNNVYAPDLINLSFPSLPSAGDIDSTDVGVLGGSGVFFDADIGKLMFNPYPWISKINSQRAHAEGGDITFPAGPIIPSFQFSDGSIIQSNGFEPNTWDFHYQHLVSGVILLDGYLLYEGTDYLISNSVNPGTADYNIATPFDFAASGARTVALFGTPPNVFSGASNVATSRAFLTPKAQPSGNYRIAAINSKQNFPAIVESGIISTWPKESDMFPNGEEAYEVLDAAFFITDCNGAFAGQIGEGLSILNSADVAPSGLVIQSPTTNRILWSQHADPTRVEAPASLAISAVGSDPYRRNISYRWPWMAGLVNVSGLYYRSCNILERTDPDTTSDTNYLVEYDESLELISAREVNASAQGFTSVPTFPEAKDIEYDKEMGQLLMSFGTDQNYIYTVYDNGIINRVYNGTTEVGQSPASGALLNRVFYSQNTKFTGLDYATSTSRSLFPDSEQVSNESGGGSGIIPFKLIDSATAGEGMVQFGTLKDINVASIIDISDQLSNPFIHDIQDISDATNITNGLWVLMTFRIGITNVWQAYFMRIVEEANYWEPVEIITTDVVAKGNDDGAYKQIAFLNGSRVPAAATIDFIYRSFT